MNILILFKMLIFKKLIFNSQVSKMFCSKITSDNKFGLSNSSTSQERQIGQNEKFKENFKSKEAKINREELLKQEITSNPEFFKAFPHLAEIVKSVHDIQNPDLNNHINENYTVTNKERQEANEKYFETLL
jgi:hypothetical protein